MHPTDSNAFWIALFAFPGVWLIFLIGAALTFKFMWLLLVVVALSLNGINLYGYVKCKRDAGRSGDLEQSPDGATRQGHGRSLI